MGDEPVPHLPRVSLICFPMSFGSVKSIASPGEIFAMPPVGIYQT